MFRFLFKFIVLPVLVILVAALAAVAYLLLTPVDESNVRSRIWQACMAGSAAKTVDNWGRRTPRPAYSPAQCECVVETVVKIMGAPVAAAGAESVRAFIKDGIGSWLSGNKYDIRRKSERDDMADAFVNSASRISRPCGAAKG